MTLVEAIDKIKQHTRNYAKRQMTWFRKDAHWQKFSLNAFDDIISFIRSKTTIG
jgi:tRNA dimethylallyltransferase